MAFLEQILENRKKCLTGAKVRSCAKIHGCLPEYAVKNAWPQVRTDALLRAYLPDDDMDVGRFPDRRFVWGVLSTLRRDWVVKYASEAARQRDELGLGDPRLSKMALRITGGWKAKLVVHDFSSRLKGKCALLLTLL